MSKTPRASILINNYNYGRYLRDSVDSALAQTYPYTEVIVVDDGSTDDSRGVLAGYGDRIVAVLKPNGGQASAFNAGFARSRGDVILFLDSDDTLLPTAVETAIGLLRDPNVAKAHWPLWEMDEHGGRTGALVPREPLPEGDLREIVLEKGPHGLNNPPTSGNAWSRRFLEKVLPVPEPEYVISADAFLFTLAPIFGRVGRTPEPQSCYRVHGANHYWHKTLAEKMKQNLRLYNNRCEMLSRHLRSMGIHVDPRRWKERDGYYAWMARVHGATEKLAAAIPPGETFILVDEAQWGGRVFSDRINLPFTEQAGQYWGPPVDDDAAIAELERLRAQWEPRFLVIAWPAFWWREHYAGWMRYLDARFRRIREDEDLVVFDLCGG